MYFISTLVRHIVTFALQLLRRGVKEKIIMLHSRHSFSTSSLNDNKFVV